MSQEFNKTTKGIIYGIGALALAVCLVACSGHNDTTAQNPPAESTPVENTAPVAPPNPVVEDTAKQEPTPEPAPEVVPTVEPEPVVSPEPPVEPTPAEPEKVEPSPEPEKEPEKEPVKTETPVVTPEPEPEKTDVPKSDESNKRVEQEAQQAQQETQGKFTYPPNSTTEGLTASEIRDGCYIDKSTGAIYTQDGELIGRAPGYGNNVVNTTNRTPEEEAEDLKSQQEQAEKEAAGLTDQQKQEMSNTGNFNNP